MTKKHKFLSEAGHFMDRFKDKALETFDFERAAQMAAAAGLTCTDGTPIYPQMLKDQLVDLLQHYKHQQTKSVSSSGFRITWCGPGSVQVDYAPRLISEYKRVDCLHEGAEPHWKFCPLCGSSLSGYSVRHTTREGGATVVFTGTREECIDYVKSQVSHLTPEELEANPAVDLENGTYYDEEEGWEVEG
jgi:hypothetical protein